MSVLVGRDTRLLVQGITGKEGAFHTKQCVEYGTKVVAGVTPGKGGQTHEGIPVFDTVRSRRGRHRGERFRDLRSAAVRRGRDPRIRGCRPPAHRRDHRRDSRPRHDARDGLPRGPGRRSGSSGPNCPGIITPGQCKIGIMPGQIHKPGRVGVVSRSGTLTYEAVDQLTRLGIGQSTCIGIGGDPVNGTNFIDCLTLFQNDPDTDAIVMIGEIGGTAEEEAAAYVKANVKKPVVSFIAGQTAPPGRRMGHAGAIISGGKGTAAEKMKTLEEAGIHVVDTPAGIGETLQRAIAR